MAFLLQLNMDKYVSWHFFQDRNFDFFFFFCKQDLLLLAIKYRRVGWGGEEVQEEGDICIPMADSL